MTGKRATDAALGKHLFDHTVRSGKAVGFIIVGCVLLVAWFVCQRTLSDELPALPPALGLLGAACFFAGIGAALNTDPGTHHVHEDGFGARCRKVNRDILYADVRRVSFRAFRVMGYSSGATLELELRGGEKIVLREMDVRFVVGGDESQGTSLYAIAILAAKQIAMRWEKELAAGRKVAWVDGTEFSPEGLIRKGTLWRWEDMPRLLRGGGTFLIQAMDNTVLLHGECAKPDFYPGMLLLESRGTKLELAR